MTGMNCDSTPTGLSTYNAGTMMDDIVMVSVSASGQTGPERGYAGSSLWDWHKLPDYLDPRYIDYARANASLGINGVVLNNVNADPRILRSDHLPRVAAIADALRPYGIRVYLSANFGAPLPPSATPDVSKEWGGIGNLETADPLDPRVREWSRSAAR